MQHIIFLHGLLGNQQDWQAVIDHLPQHTDFHYHSLDLPYHGEQQKCQVSNFAETNDYLTQQIQQLSQGEPYILVGYSLGGRISLYHALNQPPQNLAGFIVEGANLGLSDELQRQLRWQNDLHWARRFAQEPITAVLADWYQQGVFADLKFAQRQALIHKRQTNNGKSIARMLQATSLAKQPNFAQELAQFNKPFFYFCGEQDQKFQQIAKANHLPLINISNAGHNAHLANPLEFAEKLWQCISKINCGANKDIFTIIE